MKIWLQGTFVVPAIGSLPAVLIYLAISIPILVVIRLANRGSFALSPSLMTGVSMCLWSGFCLISRNTSTCLSSSRMGHQRGRSAFDIN